jgi:hypothetical protein
LAGHRTGLWMAMISGRRSPLRECWPMVLCGLNPRPAIGTAIAQIGLLGILGAQFDTGAAGTSYFKPGDILGLCDGSPAQPTRLIRTELGSDYFEIVTGLAT